MKTQALVRVRNGRPVQLRIETPTSAGVISFMATAQQKKRATVPELGEVEDGELVDIEILTRTTNRGNVVR